MPRCPADLGASSAMTRTTGTSQPLALQQVCLTSCSGETPIQSLSLRGIRDKVQKSIMHAILAVYGRLLWSWPGHINDEAKCSTLRQFLG